MDIIEWQQGKNFALQSLLNYSLFWEFFFLLIETYTYNIFTVY